MDKQFMRILMLSVLLPAGAALGQAIQQKHLSLPADHGLLSRLEAAPAAVNQSGTAVVRTVVVHREAAVRDDQAGQRSERR